MTANQFLALANACLVATSLACMITGVRAIRRGRIAAHRRLMLAASATAAVFLVLFVIRFVVYGFVEFQGDGAVRIVYQITFLSHEPLAVVNVPLVIAALVLGLTGQRRAHREVATWAYPIWLYVSVTGLLIYLFLHGPSLF